jgi:hypothetical protein
MSYLVRREYRYRQACVPARLNARRYPAERLHHDYEVQLIRQPVRELPRWTSALLRRVAGQPRYRRYGLEVPPAPGPDEPEPELLPDQWESAARLLCEHLAHSGEYAYSLERRRQDETMDPVLDFLANVKQGTCQHYAAALTLMLRSLRIPARVVKGYRGGEHLGDGTYQVRLSHAHSWVEMLVLRRDDPQAFDWVVLDPTPDTEASVPPAFSLRRWWDEGVESGRQFWHNVIVGYGSGQQADLWSDLLAGGLPARVAGGALGLLVLGAVVWLLRRRTARGPRVAAEAAFYRRLCRLLAALGLRPNAGQTAREFAALAGQALAERGEAALVDLPARVAEAYYRVRFGGRPLEEAQRRAVEAQLDALAGALKGRA